MTYSPGHNSASACARAFAASSVCAASTHCSSPSSSMSPSTVRMQKGRLIQTPNGGRNTRRDSGAIIASFWCVGYPLELLNDMTVPSITALESTSCPCSDLFHKFLHLKRRSIINNANLHLFHWKCRSNLEHNIIKFAVVRPLSQHVGLRHQLQHRRTEPDS